MNDGQLPDAQAEGALGHQLGANLVTVTLHTVVDMTFTVPGFAAGTTQRAEFMHEFPAGKGVSVSLALAHGTGNRVHRTVLLCAAGEQPLYAEVLSAAGLGASDILPGPTRTRRHVTVVDPQSRSTTHIQVKGALDDWPAHLPATITAHLLHLHQTLPDPRHAVFVFSGSLPPSFPAETYRDLVLALSAAGARCIVDTSGEALKLAVQAGPFALKPNKSELADLFNNEVHEAPDMSTPAWLLAHVSMAATTRPLWWNSFSSCTLVSCSPSPKSLIR